MSEKRVSGEQSLYASAERTWSSAQEQLRSMLSSDTYNLWFAPLRADAIEGNTLILEVANDFCEVWLKENYSGLLQDVLTVAGGRPLQAKFKVTPGTTVTAPPVKESASKPRMTAPANDRSPTNNEWNFN